MPIATDVPSRNGVICRENQGLFEQAPTEPLALFCRRVQKRSRWAENSGNKLPAGSSHFGSLEQRGKTKHKPKEFYEEE
jgi:hypothetical protein